MEQKYIRQDFFGGRNSNMMTCHGGKSRGITEVLRCRGGVVMRSEGGLLRLVAVRDGIIRITYTEREHFLDHVYPEILEEAATGADPAAACTLREERDAVIFTSGPLCVHCNRANGNLSFYAADQNGDGRLLFSEAKSSDIDGAARSVELYQATRCPDGAEVTTRKVETPDGIKDVVMEMPRIPDRELYHTSLWLRFQKGEGLYGLGQQEEGNLNLRGRRVILHQANRIIAVPLIVSSLGYGILFHTKSPLIFEDRGAGSGEESTARVTTYADEEMDAYFLYGGADGMDGVIRQYRHLTGRAPLLPKWCFGYLQSQERYCSEEELLNTAKEFRRRGLGVDALILDWNTWLDGHWGEKQLDPSRFPDAKRMNERLHGLGIHSMISIWPNMDEKTRDYQEMKAAGALLPGSNIYNAMSERARRLYWEQTREGLYRRGFDSFWMDSSEPFTPEWNHRLRPTPEIALSEYIHEAGAHLPEDETNAYSYYHAQAVFEGFSEEEVTRVSGASENKTRPEGNHSGEEPPERRPAILTRSASIGQQRFACILWSGDTSADWATLRTQVMQAQNFSMSGFPYWTVDIGAFFVKEGGTWFWNGRYPDGAAMRAYRELYVRWFEFGAFLPIFRAHGTDIRREPWNIAAGIPGDSPVMPPAEALTGFDTEVYNALARTIELRYELMPYIYSTAGRTWLKDNSMIRPLVARFPDTIGIEDQYLFGGSLMICPVTAPADATPAAHEESAEKLCEDKGPRHYTPALRKVYLPAGCGWVDFHTGRHYAGGQWLTLLVPFDVIPVFVMEGSILPMLPSDDESVIRSHALEHTISSYDETPIFQVYTGRDGSLALYRDAGDGTGYTRGEYELRHYTWSEDEKRLTDEAGQEVPCRMI